MALAWPGAQAFAQVKLEGSYTATLAGIPVGKGVWLIDVSPDQFTAAASGRTTGVLQVLAGGRGAAMAQGAIAAGRPAPTTFSSSIVTEKRANEVKMALSGGNVKEISAEPPSSPYADRVPITDAHRQGVLDPMSAALIPVPGNGALVSREACNRTLAIFDGRGRFDLTLSFKRIDQVKAEKGYQGPAAVCAVAYRPVSGHRSSQSAVKYLMARDDIELWLAPVAGTRLLVPFRVSVPTVLGTAVVEATQFVTVTQAARSTPTNLKTQ